MGIGGKLKKLIRRRLMSHKQYFISDTHFTHKNFLSFTDDEGNLVRPFKSVEEMDELMIENWNKRVRAVDRIYHLGDVCIHRRALKILERLNGKKVLIRGNHDIFKLKDYTLYFEDIRSYKVMPGLGFIFSHIPIHTNGLKGRWVANIHGHLHQNKLEDARYLNICVENTDYAPLTLEEIITKVQVQQKNVSWLEEENEV